MIRRIISGGQTGADRAALDVAVALGIPSGGWVPRGRLAEDGRIPDRYHGLVETTTDRYEERTELNVRDADATVVFSFGPPAGGSAHTERVARAMGKPVLAIDLAVSPSGEAAAGLRRWLDEVKPSVLNVAGPRSSREPRIHDAVSALLRAVLGPPGASAD